MQRPLLPLICLLCLLFAAQAQAQVRKDAATRRADSLTAIEHFRTVLALTYSNPAQAKKHAKEVVRIARKTGIATMEAGGNNALGLCYRNLSEYDSALVVFEKASRIHRSLKDRGSACMAENNVGMTWFYIGEYEKANTMILNVIREGEEHKMNPVLANAYQNLGIIYESQQRYLVALENFVLAEKYHQMTDNPRGESGAAINQAVIYSKHLRQYDKAIAIYDRVIPIKQKVKDEKGVGIAYNNLGDLYLKKGDLPKALESINKAIPIRLRMNDQFGLASSYSTLSKIYLARENYTEAEEYANKAVAIAERIGARKEQAEYYRLQSTVQHMRDNHKEAYRILSNAVVLKDSVFNTETLTRMADLETKYQTEKKEKLIAENSVKLLKAEAEAREKEKLIADNSIRLLMAEAEARRKEKLIAENVARLLRAEADGEKKEKLIIENRARLLETEAESDRKGKQIAENKLKIDEQNLVIYGIAAVAIIGLLIGLIVYNRQKLKTIRLEKEAELKDALLYIETQNKLQEQRLQISRDLHDNIGSQLTFIISSLDNLKYGYDLSNNGLKDRIAGIGNFTKDTITELRDTIWAMNKEEITLQDLGLRISNFIEHAKAASKGIHFEFDIDPALPDTKSFSSLKGINLYRVIQESVNNALKHADATAVAVDISANGKGYAIKIDDNGRGFNPEASGLGNGLANIRKRVADCGGELAIVSSEGQGTSIIVHIK